MNIMKSFTICLLFLLPMATFAKRTAPKQVEPVVKDGIEYSVSSMETITAKWLKTGKTIWIKQIYVVKFDYLYGLEEDVQDCYINSLKLKGKKLLIKNEQGSVFELDSETLQQTTVSGSAVVDSTKIGKPEKK